MAINLDDEFAATKELQSEDGVKIYLETEEEVEPGEERAFVRLVSSENFQFKDYQSSLMDQRELQKIRDLDYENASLHGRAAKAIAHAGFGKKRPQWGGLKRRNDQGELVDVGEFSPAKAETLFRHHQTLVDHISREMARESNFRHKFVAAGKKGFRPESPGASNTPA